MKDIKTAYLYIAYGTFIGLCTVIWTSKQSKQSLCSLDHSVKTLWITVFIISSLSFFLGFRILFRKIENALLKYVISILLAVLLGAIIIGLMSIFGLKNCFSI